MIQLIKSIPIKLVPLIAFVLMSVADYAYSEDAPVHIPIPANDPRFEDVMTVTQDPAVDDLINQTKEQVRSHNARTRLLFTQVGEAVGDVVGDIVKKETRAKTRKKQMEAMQDPDNPDSVSHLIAPTF